MPISSLLIFEKKAESWGAFLRAYFAGLPVSMRVVDEPSQAAALFDKILPRVVFLTPCFLNKVFLQKLKVRKNTDPGFRAYLLGENTAGFRGFPWDGVFPDAASRVDFDRRFAETLPMPEMIRMLVVDDEEEVAAMVRDYFGGRTAPAFEIEYAPNGAEGLEAIARRRPDVIVLDIKMPVMDGREFYSRLKTQKADIPVIVFFDSISGEELAEIRKYGNPPAVEKGTLSASLPALMALTKKMIYFGM